MSLNIFIGLNEHPNRAGEYSVLPIEATLATAFVFSFVAKFADQHKKFEKTEMYEFERMLARKEVCIIFKPNKKDVRIKVNPNKHYNICINLERFDNKSIYGIQDAVTKLIGNNVNLVDEDLKDFIDLENMIANDVPVPNNTGPANILAQMVLADLTVERIITSPNAVFNKKGAISDARCDFINEIHKMMLNAMPSYK
tara:strand:+ start:3181 stop:3774 length:594 start_codon:yes stop_codon:yes gene_type:complete